ncbi:hypothetical protein WDB88_11445 [Thioclava sp. GXIMD4216]
MPLLALPLMAGPASADDAKKTACAPVAELLALAKVDYGTQEQNGDRCIFRDLVVPIPLDLAALYADELDVSLRGMDAGLRPDALPSHVDLRVSNLFYGIRGIEGYPPKMAYLQNEIARMAAYQVALDLDWNEEDAELRLNRMEVTDPLGQVSQLSFTLGSVTPAFFAAPVEQASFPSVEAFSLDLALPWLFEAVALMPMGMALLPEEGDPAAALAALQTQYAALAEALPDAYIDAPSRAALVRLIGDLPHPQHALSVDLRGRVPSLSLTQEELQAQDRAMAYGTKLLAQGGFGLQIGYGPNP